MRNLGIVCLLLGLSNVGYGQEAGCCPKAVGCGEACAKGGHLQTAMPVLSQVPYAGRLFQVMPPGAPPPLPPCPTMRPTSVPIPPVARMPVVIGLPDTDDARLGHLLEAAEHLTAAGETGQAQRVQQLAVAEAKKLAARLNALKAEVAELRRHSSQGQQIRIELKFLELSRTKMRALGFDFVELLGNDVQPAAYNDRTFGVEVVDGEPPILGMLDALQKDGLAKVLAEPTLVTVSGRPAFCFVGGEVPAVVTRDDGSQKIEQREYGTRVDVVAVALGKGRIRLELRPSIRELDAAASMPGKPVINVREVETGVELKSGQTVIIGGMVQNRVETKNIGIPWLEDIPLVGELFRTIEEHVEETEFVILAKAEIVAPMPVQASPVSAARATTSPVR